MATRLTGVAVAALVGGGLGAAVLTPGGAGAAVRTPAATVVTTTVTARAAAAGCGTGRYQKQVETLINKLGGFGRTKVDGKQSAADCAVIKKFQKRYGIQPAQGLAGPTTYDVAQRLAATSIASCKAKKTGVQFCIDLTHQTAWLMKNGKRYTNPTVVRTGMKNYRTPAGKFTINKRTKKEWSDPYEVWLPYWQRFIGGRGFHQTTTYLHDKWRGSHGCVNLLPQDARTYWTVGRIGMTVKVIGRRPGT